MMMKSPKADSNAPPDGSLLEIDLAALAQNYTRLCEMAGVATAAVVKADAYGLGMAAVAPVLLAAGCRVFFVAQAQEGAKLRALAPQADIYVLNGYIGQNADYYRRARLIACLSTPEQIAAFRADKLGLPAALHFDSGFNRLGLSQEDLLDTPLDGIEPCLIMSHLACADTPDHPMNMAQLERFRDMSAAFDCPRSLANTGGVWLGKPYTFDLVRVGIGLYGGSPSGAPEHALAPVVRFSAALLQKRRLAAGETIGYGATFTAPREMQIGIIAAGYADGIARAAGRGAPPFAEIAIGENRAAVLGRVSMDLLAVDMSDIDAPIGAAVEIIGPNMPLDKFAKAAQTISYEVLTGLGIRAKRVYTRGDG